MKLVGYKCEFIQVGLKSSVLLIFKCSNLMTDKTVFMQLINLKPKTLLVRSNQNLFCCGIL